MNEVDQFFKAFYAQLKELFLDIEGEVYGFTEHNYWEKTMQPSNIDEDDFKPIEQRLGFSLPASFKEFYTSYYSLEEHINLVGISIAGNREHDGLSSLKRVVFENGMSAEMLELGLLPFGVYNDGWFICLDMNKNQDNPAIVLFEMSNCDAGKEAISHRQWFSNFNSFLKCMTDYLLKGNWDDFNELDPNNNYLTAYDYWKK